MEKICTCNERFTCDNCKQDAQERLDKYIKKGAFCRVCNDYNEYAEPDRLAEDDKYTCWSCGTHPERKRKGLTSGGVRELNKKYSKKKK